MPERTPIAAIPKSVADEADLWLVIAIIQPFKLDSVTLALEDLPGFGGMTVTDCRGFGHGKVTDEGVDGAMERSRSAPNATGSVRAEVLDFTPKVRLEIAVAGREGADRIVATIGRAAHTGRRGDGKVFAFPLSAALRIRTFDEGSSAV